MATVRLKAIIFDFDFTLVDSSSGIVQCVEYALQHLGLQIPPAEQIINTIGLSLSETFSSLTGQCNVESASRFAQRFHERADQIMDKETHIYPYVKPVMESLCSASLRLGIVSTKLHYRVMNILAGNSLEKFFEVIVGADDVNKAKPDPEGLLLALRAIKVDANDALYVGDHTIDGRAAEGAGTPFLAVLSGRHSREDFDHIPNLGILESVRGLPDFLGL